MDVFGNGHWGGEKSRGDESHKVAVTRTLKIEGSTEGGCQVHRELC